jgi:hypothetical protein
MPYINECRLMGNLVMEEVLLIYHLQPPNLGRIKRVENGKTKPTGII